MENWQNLSIKELEELENNLIKELNLRKAKVFKAKVHKLHEVFTDLKEFFPNATFEVWESDKMWDKEKCFKGYLKELSFDISLY